MPKRDNAVNAVSLFNTPRRSPRFLREETLRQENATAIGNSSRASRRRMVAQERGDLKSPKELAEKSHKCCSENVSKKPSKSSEGLGIRANLSSGSRKSRVLGDGIEGFLNLRRSLRISDLRNELFVSERKGLRDKVAKKFGDSSHGSRNRGGLNSRSVKSGRTSNGVEEFQKPRRSPRILSQLREKTRKEALWDKGENFAAQKGERKKLRSDLVDSKAGIERAREQEAEEEKEFECGKGRVVEISRRRKLEEFEESHEEVQGWTKEQELALQRAYLIAKPTPQFWKKVSRMVPGKSAQDCFDKLNSDYATPPQRHRVSRAKKKHSSPVPPIQLSASKVLKPTNPKFRKPSLNKQKSYLTHKNARQLLQEHYHQSQVREVDLFSVLEPNLDLARQPYQKCIELSTPKQPQEKIGFHQRFNERSTSGHKKPLSRFSASRHEVLASPPVLKMVKNKVLHDKYIDQLHIRDAQRKTAFKQAVKSSSKIDDRNVSHNVVLAAKNALVTDARDAITMLQHVESNSMNDSSDLEFDVDYGDESEIEM